MQRMKWVDGLKGLACLGIFYHHFLLRYAPESYYEMRNGPESLFSRLADIPFGFMINGNFLVFLFILISGYVVSKRVMNTSNGEIGKFVITRYFKLAFPIFVCESIYYICFILGVGKNQLFVDDDNVGSYFMVLKNSFIGVLCFGDTKFAGAYWMMNFIFVGGIIIIAISLIGWKSEKYAMIVFAIISLALLTQKIFYYSAIFLGAFLFYYLKRQSLKIPKYLYILIGIVGMFLGGYPTGLIPHNGIYHIFTLSFDIENSAYIWHWLAAFLMFYSIYHLSIIQNILEMKFIQWLGGISYILFVFHNFMRKLMDPLYYWLLNYYDSQVIALFFYSSIVLILLFLFCEIYKRTFDVLFVKLIAIIVKPLA